MLPVPLRVTFSRSVFNSNHRLVSYGVRSQQTSSMFFPQPFVETSTFRGVSLNSLKTLLVLSHRRILRPSPPACLADRRVSQPHHCFLQWLASVSRPHHCRPRLTNRGGQTRRQNDQHLGKFPCASCPRWQSQPTAAPCARSPTQSLPVLIVQKIWRSPTHVSKLLS